MARLAPTDINDPQTGEPLYVQMRKPNWFRYQWKMWKLFFGIVHWPWQKRESDEPFANIGPRLAWSIAWDLNTYWHDRKVWKHAKEVQDGERA